MGEASAAEPVVEPIGGYSEESLFGGRLSCRQHRLGYRFSMDAVLLAHFAIIDERDRVLELGGGCGIISLAIAYRHPTAAITAVEVQPQLAALLRENVRRNNYDDRIAVIEGDWRNVREYLPAAAFDAVIVNPPYHVYGSGRPCVHPERLIARQEVHGGLADLAKACAWALRDGGLLAVVFPACRVTTLLAVLKEQGLAPRRLRMVHGYPDGDASLALVEAVKEDGEGMRMLPSLSIYDQRGGAYSDEVLKMYEG